MPSLLAYFYEIVIKEYSAGITVDPTKTDSLKNTILHWAIQCYQSAEMIDLLILQGANVNAQTELKETALMLAAKTGQVEIVKLLINRGANINARDRLGATAPQNLAKQISLNSCLVAAPTLMREVKWVRLPSY